MVINYKRTQKTILRVNPRVPLSELLPAICEKCEFDTETTVLMKDGQSLTPLDLSSSLNDYAIREVYARDTKGMNFVFKPPLFALFNTVCVSLHTTGLCVIKSHVGSAGKAASALCPSSPADAGMSLSKRHR